MDNFPNSAALADSFIAQSEHDSAGIAMIGMPSIRERQAVIMRERLAEIAKRREGRMLVGLTEVTSLSTSAIGDLVGLSKSCREMGGRLVLFGVSRQIMESIRAAGLHRSLDIAPDRAAAAAMLKARPARTGGRLGMWGKKGAA